jgi:hypothetical protein
MTEFAPPDALAAVMEDEEEAQLPDNSHSIRGAAGGQQDWLSAFAGGGGAGGAAAQEDWLAAYRARAAPARAGLRRNSADYSVVETTAFLRACGLCRRRLGPGRDTFMYKYVFAPSPPARLARLLHGYSCLESAAARPERLKLSLFFFRSLTYRLVLCRGEAAFCSLECRERHITQEEWKDKCAVTSIKDAAAGAAKKANGRRAGSGKAGGTVAAA